jgi:glycerol kinase
MKKYILAIDHGTTSTRAILFDKKANIVGISQKETSIQYPRPGWVMQDADEIWHAVLEVISQVILKNNIDPSEVAALGISNQRETSVLWSKKTGMPVTSAIVWQSKQTKDICQRWKENEYEELIHQKTGLCIDPYFSASKIVWFFEQYPELKNNDDILFGTMDSWIVYKLTGETTHITDVSNASRTLLYNIHDLKWDDELLELFDIPKTILPKVMPTSYMYANCKKEYFFGVELPICSVVGDQQAALFGQGCFEKGMVKNTYGTGGFMLMNTGSDIVNSKHGLLSTVAWQIGDTVKYALEGSIFVSGSLIKWLRDSLKLFENASDTCQMAQAVDDTNGVVIVPAFVGLGAPYWNDDCQGCIVGLTFGTTPNHIVRAAIESQAYQSKDVLDAMVQDSGIEITSLKVDGGATSNDFLLQFQSDLIRLPVQRFQTKELTSLGAAYLAGIACGFWKEDELKLELNKEFVPSDNEKRMQKLYEQWQKAIKTCVSYK